MKKIFSFLTMLLLTCSMAWADDFSATDIATTTGTTKNHVTSSSTFTSTSSQDVCSAKQTIVSISGSANGTYSSNYIEIQAAEDYVIDSPIEIVGSINKTDANSYSIAVVFWSGAAAADFNSVTTTVIPNKNATGDACETVSINVPANTRTIRFYRAMKHDGNTFNGNGTQEGSGQTTYIQTISASATPTVPVTTYSITYDLNGGTGTTPTESAKAEGSSFALHDGVTGITAPNNKTFAGWNDGTNTYNGGALYTMGATNVTLTAQWANAYTVTYNPNGATGEPFVDNNAVAIAANMFTTPDGKRFTGWNTAADGTGTDYAVDAAVTNNLTLYAQWEKVCGELIKATLTDGVTAVVTGNIGGTATANLTKSNRKMDKGKSFGVTLASGTFMVGDEVNINVSTAGTGGVVCLFADQNRTIPLYVGTDAGVAGDNIIVLPAAANGLTSLWIARDGDDATYKWNPCVSYISVSRSCVPSSDASIASLTVNGDAVVAEANVYSVELSSSYSDPTVTVAYTLGHPLATATPASGFTINVPSAGAAANTQVITVTAEDGTQANYTVSVSKSTSLNNDATLSALSVTGYTLSPDFAPATTAYTITKVYGADNPTTDKVNATKNDENASNPVVTLNDNVFSIVVTAEDGETTKTYTITINTAAAPRDIKEIVMTNGYKAYVPAGTFDIYAYYLNGQDAPTIYSNVVAEGANLSVNGNTVTVTGADSGSDDYTLHVTAVSPLAFTADKITFDGTETYVKSGYGWNADRKWRFSKTDNDYSREVTGKTHVEMFLPACDMVELFEAGVATRDVKIYINGEQIGEKYSLEKNKSLLLPVMQQAAFMLTIESAQTSGDGGVGAIQLSNAENDVITLGANGYSTYANSFNYTVSGATVYKAAVNGNKDAVILTEVADAVVPANAGIILKGNQGANVTITPAYTATSNFSDNKLVGVVTATTAPGNAYALATNLDEDGLTKFHPCTGIEIPAHKAYLVIEGANPQAAPIRIIFEDQNATNINNIEGAEEAVKFVENGQLFIKKNGKIYNAVGAVVK